MRRWFVALTATALLLGGCSGGSAKIDSNSPDEDVASSDLLAPDDAEIDEALPEPDLLDDAAAPDDTPEPDLAPEIAQIPCTVDAECNDLDPCTVDLCEPDYGCVNTPKSCSDNNACTIDNCRASDGQCLHNSLDCADDNACTEESCDSVAGCVYAAVDCNDGQACTADGCNPQTGCNNKVKNCDDGDPCTDDSCSEPGGCNHAPSADPNCCVADFECNDSLPCTLDACTNYSCVYTPIPGLTCCDSDEECADENDCTENLCTDGLCQFQPAGPGCCMVAADCEDGDGCTTEDCLDYACIYAPVPDCCHDALDCDDQEVCTTDECAMAGPNFGFCNNKAILECCHDNDAECDDDNLCTLDVCPGMGDICTHEWAENCCLAVSDCDDEESCTQDSCLENECGHVDICCYDDAECDDGDDVCTTETCDNNFCVYEPTGVEGCCNIPLFEDDFQGNLGWDYGPNWNRGATAVSVGTAYGNPDPALDHTGSDDNFVAGVVVAGNAPTDSVHDFYYLTSPAVNAAGVDDLTLSYWRFLNSDYQPYMTNNLQVFDGANWVEIWATGPSPGIQDPQWVYQEFDVGDYANSGFKIRFGYAIGYNGVFTVSSWNVDDVKIYAKGSGALCCEWPSDCQTTEAPEAKCSGGICFLGECEADEECDDQNACTADSCDVGGTCVNAPLPECCLVDADCVPAEDCQKGTCANNSCKFEAMEDCCTEDGECEDQDACTTDSCNANSCVHTPVLQCCQSDEECDDSEACTTDSCVDNSCLNEAIPDCA